MVVWTDAGGRMHGVLVRDRWAKVALEMEEQISPLDGILGHTLEITICDRPARVERYPLRVHLKHLLGSRATKTVDLGRQGSDTTIQCLKEMYSGDGIGAPKTQDFYLIYRERLREHRTLGDYRIPDDATIIVRFPWGLDGVRDQGDDPLTYADLRGTKESFLKDQPYFRDAHVLEWREERLQRMSIPVTGSLFLWPPGSTMREVNVTFTRDLSNHDFFARLQHSIDHLADMETEEENEESIPVVVLESAAVSEDDDNSRRYGTADTKRANVDDDAHGNDGDGDDIPPSFRCPITRCIMRDPVVAMDGNTYERTAIE